MVSFGLLLVLLPVVVVGLGDVIELLVCGELSKLDKVCFNADNDVIGRMDDTW